MLILTRRMDQGVRIFDDTGRYIGRFRILGIERDRVKLGIEADARFVILRDELVDDAKAVAS